MVEKGGIHCAVKKHHDAAHEKEAAWWDGSIGCCAHGVWGAWEAYLPPEQKATPISIQS